jgi:hypothetical protein
MVRRRVVEFVEVYIFIYNGLNEGSFYQVGACLQASSCMRIGFLTSQLDLHDHLNRPWSSGFSRKLEHYFWDKPYLWF